MDVSRICWSQGANNHLALLEEGVLKGAWPISAPNNLAEFEQYGRAVFYGGDAGGN